MKTESSQGKHNLRFYLLLLILVIGGIFIFFMLNDGKNEPTITNAVVTDLETDLDEDIFNSEIKTKRIVSQEKNEIVFQLAVDTVPTSTKEAKAKQIELGFSDTTARIKINNDKLELNDLSEVRLQVDGFVGEIVFNDGHLSFDGTAKRINVNGVAFSSSQKDLKLSFTNLEYQSLVLRELELAEVEFSKGSGTFNVGEKLQYVIDDEEIQLAAFAGDLKIDRVNMTSVSLEGITEGISISGNTLGLSLQ